VPILILNQYRTGRPIKTSRTLISSISKTLPKTDSGLRTRASSIMSRVSAASRSTLEVDHIGQIWPGPLLRYRYSCVLSGIVLGPSRVEAFDRPVLCETAFGSGRLRPMFDGITSKVDLLAAETRLIIDEARVRSLNPF